MEYIVSYNACGLYTLWLLVFFIINIKGCFVWLSVSVSIIRLVGFEKVFFRLFYFWHRIVRVRYISALAPLIEPLNNFWSRDHPR